MGAPVKGDGVYMGNGSQIKWIFEQIILLKEVDIN